MSDTQRMPRRHLGALEVSAIGLGCMSMSGTYGAVDAPEAERTLRRALDIGVTFFDTANVYGLGENERLIGRVLADVRNQIEISTKFGFALTEKGMGVDGHPSRVAKRCDESLERLGTDYVDLYFLHRIDPDVPVEDTVGAMAQLVQAGKVRHLGLCEVAGKTLRRANAVHPIAAVQSEYSLWTRDPEAHVLPICRELGVGFVPFSPVGRAILTGTLDTDSTFPPGQDLRSGMPRFDGSNLAINLAMVDELKSLASFLAISPAQLALAWLLGRGEAVVPIPGTKRVAYLEENAAAATIGLDPPTIAKLDEIFDPDRVTGARYAEGWMVSADAGSDD